MTLCRFDGDGIMLSDAKTLVLREGEGDRLDCKLVERLLGEETLRIGVETLRAVPENEGRRCTV